MKRKRSLKRRVSPRSKKALSSKLTLEQVVKAAHEAGATVTVSLVPHAPERPRLKLSTKDWPGDPYTRSTMADLNYDEKDVAKVFKDNPTSQWVITPYEVFERTKFFSPKPAPTPEGEQVDTNPS
jgi:hypothetical protein